MPDAESFKLTVKSAKSGSTTAERLMAPVLEAIRSELLSSIENGVGDLAFHGSTSVSGLEAGQLNIAREALQ